MSIITHTETNVKRIIRTSGGNRLYTSVVRIIDKYITSRRMTIDSMNRLIVAYRMFPVMFRDENNEETGELLFSYAIIARMAGKEHEARAKNFSSREVIQRYKRLFPNDTIFESRYFADEYMTARRILPEVLPETLQYAIDMMLLGKYDGEQMIDIASNSVWTKAKRSALRHQTQADAKAEIEKAKTPQQRYMLNYHVNQSARIFSGTETTIPDMRKAIPKRVNKNAMAGALLGISDEPKPQYSVAENTMRLIPMYPCLATIPKEMRRAATKKLGWEEFDLRNAGLAIAMKLYKDNKDLLDIFMPLLTGDISIWQIMTDAFSVPYDDTTKKIMKQAINQVLHGGNYIKAHEDIISKLEKHGYTVKVILAPGEQMSIVWTLLVSLGHAVRDRIAQIKKDGGLYLDRWIPLIAKDITHKSKYNKNKRYVSGKRYNYTSLLAQEIQYFEHLLIYPVYPLATENMNAFAITTYQNDGFNVKFFCNKDYWAKRIIEVVNQNAIHMGIPTELIMKDV